MFGFRPGSILDQSGGKGGPSSSETPFSAYWLYTWNVFDIFYSASVYRCTYRLRVFCCQLCHRPRASGLSGVCTVRCGLSRQMWVNEPHTLDQAACPVCVCVYMWPSVSVFTFFVSLPNLVGFYFVAFFPRSDSNNKDQILILIQLPGTRKEVLLKYNMNNVLMSLKSLFQLEHSQTFL